jgi:hypothetical protein
MALLIPPGYACTVLKWTSVNFDSGNAATVFGAGEDLGPDPTSYNTFAGYVRDATVEHILPLMDSGITLASIEVFGEDDGIELAVGEPGGVGIVSPPPNVTTLIKKVVGGRGRRRQGRMFWPGLLATNVVGENGIITTTAVNAIQDGMDNWLTDWSLAALVNMVILQNSEGVTPPVSPPPPATGLIVQNKVASQRQRLRR